MRVALDATPLAAGGHLGGLGRYTSQLIAALAQEFPTDEFLLISDQPFEMPVDLPNVHRANPPRNVLERRWWTVGLGRELRRHAADVFHGVNFAVPFPPAVPAVMTLHDLSPWAEGPWVDKAWRARSARIRKSVPWLLRTRAARHIITDSEAIRSEAIRRFSLDPSRISAIPLAAANRFRPRQVDRPGAPYFLYAGMWERRKNVDAVIAAWSAIRSQHEVDLVIAGPRRDELPLPVPTPGLILRGEVSEVELAELYAGAIALVYPSHYEGFGLPVLEAMQCGTPVIISSDPALIETAGDAALRPDNLAEAMRALLDNLHLRAQLRVRSLARAACFTWQRTARDTHNVYRSMLAK